MKFRNLKLEILATTLAVMSFDSAQAANLVPVQMGAPSYRGSGCPQGTMSTVMSEDNRLLSILFDQYIAEAGPGMPIDTKQCSILIPFRVPRGMQLAVLSVDYRGFQSIPEGGAGGFVAEHFFKSRNGGRLGDISLHIEQNFTGPTEDLFTVSGAKRVRWAECSETSELVIQSNLRARTNRFNEQTMVQVDTLDTSHVGTMRGAGMKFNLYLSPCGPGNSGGVTPPSHPGNHGGHGGIRPPAPGRGPTPHHPRDRQHTQ